MNFKELREQFKIVLSEYKDLNDKKDILPIGKQIELNLDYITDYINTGFEYLKDEPQILAGLERTGSGDFFKGVLECVENIRKLIKE